jgi:hypothetical protein
MCHGRDGPDGPGSVSGLAGLELWLLRYALLVLHCCTWPAISRMDLDTHGVPLLLLGVFVQVNRRGVTGHAVNWMITVDHPWHDRWHMAW